MRVITLGPEKIGAIPIEDAFEAIYNADILKKLYGPSLKVTPWTDDERTLEFDLDMCDIPHEIQKIFNAPKLHVTNTQQVSRSCHSKWEINNEMKLHFLGSDLLTIQPYFVLHRQGDITYLTGVVEHQAKLPPPLNGIAEHYMSLQTEKQLTKYKSILKRMQVDLEQRK